MKKKLNRSFWSNNLRYAIEQASSLKSRETLVYMTPEQFLKLAEPLPMGRKGTDTEELEKVIENKGFRDVPYFKTTHRGNLEFKIIGHEGRHRSLAFIRQGMGRMLMPVRIIDDSLRWIEDELSGDVITLIPEKGSSPRLGLRLPSQGELTMTAKQRDLESQSKKKRSARSNMLRMVMPMLSRGAGEKLAAAIEDNNVGAMRNAMNEVVRGMEKKMQMNKRRKKK
jgi:hypothetical protein